MLGLSGVVHVVGGPHVLHGGVLAALLGPEERARRILDAERGAAQAVEETAAVAAEEGEVAVAAEGVGGAFGYLGGLAEGAAALAPTAGEVAGTLAGAAGVGAAATAGLAVGIAGGAAYGLARGTGWVLENLGHHAVLKAQHRVVDGAVSAVAQRPPRVDEVPPPCCAPTGLSSRSR